MSETTPEELPPSPKIETPTNTAEEAAKREAAEKAAKNAAEKAALAAAADGRDAEANADEAVAGLELPPSTLETEEKPEGKSGILAFFTTKFKSAFEALKGLWNRLFGKKQEDAPSAPSSNSETPPVPETEAPHAETPAAPKAPGSHPKQETETQAEGQYTNFIPGTFEIAKGASYTLILKDGTKIQIPQGGKNIQIGDNRFKLSTDGPMGMQYSLNVIQLTVNRDESASLTMGALGQERTADMDAKETLALMSHLNEHKNDERFQYEVMSKDGESRILTFTKA